MGMIKEQPLVSFFVISYKQEEFIRDAIQGAFAQTYEPLEIILSDDCSPDRTFEIIKEETESYSGPHRIILNQNESNQGIAGNLNRALELAKGQFIIASAGDDISLPERTAEIVKRLQETESPVDMVCSYCEEIDETGKPIGQIQKDVLFLPDTNEPVRKWACGATGACLGYNRKLYDKFGPLDIRVIAEDWVLPFRAWVESGIALVDKPLVKHRVHGRCLSVIYQDINAERTPESRHLLRRKTTGSTLARAKDWLHVWQISGDDKDGHIGKQMKEWIRLLEIEWRAYDLNRLQALKSAIKAMHYSGGFKVALRIFYRLVLRRQ